MPRSAARQRPLSSLVSNEVGLGIVPDNALARRFRDEAGPAQPALAAARRPRALHGGRPAHDREVTKRMTEHDRCPTPKTPAPPQGEDGQAQGRAGRRGRGQDHHEKGLLIVHTGPGKGKSTAAFGLVLRALGPWLAGRRRAVHQGRLGDRRAPCAGALRRSRALAHDGRGLHLGDPGPRPRHRRRRARLGKGARADGRPRDPPAGARRAEHRAALRLPAARRGGGDAERAPARTCTSSSPGATPSRSWSRRPTS